MPWLHQKKHQQLPTRTQSAGLLYLSLVRSKLEYACVSYNPISNKNISILEKVQREAARFVKQYYSTYNSVTRMIHELGWINLQNRSKD